MIINLFSLCLRRKKCKFLFPVKIDLFISHLRRRSINIQFIIIMDLFTMKEYKFLIFDINGFIHPSLQREKCQFLIHNNNLYILFQFCMIIYDITYPSCKVELHQYFILNDTNFYLSPNREKGDFVLLELRLWLGLCFIIRHTLIEFNSVIMGWTD